MAFDRDGSRVLVFERLANGDLTVNWEWAWGFLRWWIGACFAITTATEKRTSSPAT